MGHHYVPQEYLRGFSDVEGSNRVWMLARGDAAPRLLPVGDVAQSRGYYEAETEKWLADVVEGPANPVLRKLRRGEAIVEEERFAFALYVATMLKRGPKSRERAEAMLPAVLEQTIASVKEEFRSLAAESDAKRVAMEKHFVDLEKAHAKFKVRPPEAVLDKIRDPRPSSTIIKLVFQMYWRILIAPKDSVFITSDNPAFFHGGYGVGTPKSELRFPLSPKYALHGTWQPNALGPLTFHDAPRDWVREFNRSIASDASKLVFCNSNAWWLKELVEHKNPYLFRLIWT